MLVVLLLMKTNSIIRILSYKIGGKFYDTWFGVELLTDTISVIVENVTTSEICAIAKKTTTVHSEDKFKSQGVMVTISLKKHSVYKVVKTYAISESLGRENTLKFLDEIAESIIVLKMME